MSSNFSAHALQYVNWTSFDLLTMIYRNKYGYFGSGAAFVTIASTRNSLCVNT